MSNRESSSDIYPVAQPLENGSEAFADSANDESFTLPELAEIELVKANVTESIALAEPSAEDLAKIDELKDHLMAEDPTLAREDIEHVDIPVPGAEDVDAIIAAGLAARAEKGVSPSDAISEVDLERMNRAEHAEVNRVAASPQHAPLAPAAVIKTETAAGTPQKANIGLTDRVFDVTNSIAEKVLPAQFIAFSDRMQANVERGFSKLGKWLKTSNVWIGHP